MVGLKTKQIRAPTQHTYRHNALRNVTLLNSYISGNFRPTPSFFHLTPFFVPAVKLSS